MPIQTNLSVSPYFDDFSNEKDYYKILFQPSVAVQVRELNQLQTLLQKQIETFGDHILKRGTVLNGCQFSFHPRIPFVKIKDTTDIGAAATPIDYETLLVKNSSNLVSIVVASNTGFESQDPDLKTLYLNYTNSGDSGNLQSYANGQTLTVYNSDLRLYRVRINNASQGFSNNDSLVILSSIEVQNTTGGTTFSNGAFQVGETITQDTTLATGVITAVNATANSSSIVLQIRPLTGELTRANTDSWSFSTGLNFTSDVTGNEAVVTGFVGSGATGTITTTGAGAISSVRLATQGSNYYVDPHVTISTTVASNTQVNTLSLTPNAFIANVVVASVTNSTGFAYGVTTTEGVIYQKGYFLRTEPQFLIVDKYNNTPNAISIGFNTTESVVNSSIDTTLVDNASGFLNQNAPGANRLKLVPELTFKTDVEAEADPEFLPLVKFSEGRPYYQSKQTEYNTVSQELARRTFEESGNYVLDRFNLTTRSTNLIANSDSHFTYVIDPGHAYIDGYRVKTVRDYSVEIEKATETETFSNSSFDIIYGNYVLVKEFAGIHTFTQGQQISLRDTAVSYISNYSSDIAAAVVGTTEIGKARIRGVMYQGGGDQGTPEAIYRIYLFDIRMNAGKNFKNVRSIFTDNASGVDGVADLVLETTAGSSGAEQSAVLKLPERNSLVINTNRPLQSVSNIEYQYRTLQQNLTANTVGIFTVSAKTNSVWPYSGQLSSFEENDLIILPEEDLIDTTLIDTVNASADVSSGVLTGTGFIAALDAGDYIHLDDGANTAIARVVSVTNNTSLVYAPNTAFDALAGDTGVYRCYPTGVPVPMSRRDSAFAQISGTTMTVDLDIDLAAAANVSIISNQRFTGTSSTPVSKQAVRNNFVLIDCANNVANTTGPWCLGFSDIIRLRNVYLGDSVADTNVTRNFHIDHNQNANYYGLGLLRQNSDSTLTLDANTQLLVEFDYTTHNKEGVKTVSSYTVNDEVSLGSLTTDVNTLEIPEMYDQRGVYYDLRECIDFRPRTANTVAATSNSEIAPINPPLATESTRFVGSDLFFPVPEGDMFCNYTEYKARKDQILLSSSGNFEILKGQEIPTVRESSKLNIYEAYIPPYPSLPENLSNDVLTILSTRVLSGNNPNRRFERFRIETSAVDQQFAGYTMEEIAKLERRIAALEYYTNLSILEDQVKNTVIPSSVDSTLERFKFGFFVDNFENFDYIEVANPEHKAVVYEKKMSPAAEQYVTQYVVSNTSMQNVTQNHVSFDYQRKKLFSQTKATDGAVIPPSGTTTTPDPDPVLKVGTKCTYVKHDSRISGKTQERIFTLTSNTDVNTQITVQFNHASAGDRIEIYQSRQKDGGWELIGTTSSGFTLVNLTSSERNTLKTESGESSWTSTANFSKVGDFHIGVGKFTFDYVPSRGRYLRVRVVESGSSYWHHYKICYPVDLLDNLNTVTVVEQSNQTTNTPSFTLINRNISTSNTNPIRIASVQTNSKPIVVTSKPNVSPAPIDTGVRAQPPATVVPTSPPPVSAPPTTPTKTSVPTPTPTLGSTSNLGGVRQIGNNGRKTFLH